MYASSEGPDESEFADSAGPSLLAMLLNTAIIAKYHVSAKTHGYFKTKSYNCILNQDHRSNVR